MVSEQAAPFTRRDAGEKEEGRKLRPESLGFPQWLDEEGPKSNSAWAVESIDLSPHVAIQFQFHIF